MEERYKITLAGLVWSNGEEPDFLFETIEETFEKAKFFLDQGYTVTISNIVDEE